MNLTMCATGHRPSKLPGGYSGCPALYQAMKDLIQAAKPEHMISGMALGVDQMFAKIAIELEIPWTAAIPCDKQEARWPQASKDHYQWLLSRADRVVIVSPGPYAGWKMQIRNEWMVDNSDVIMAVWIPLETSGGTYNCVQYASKKGLPTIHINPLEFKC